jgi:hypothetical protein
MVIARLNNKQKTNEKKRVRRRAHPKDNFFDGLPVFDATRNLIGLILLKEREIAKREIHVIWRCSALP